MNEVANMIKNIKPINRCPDCGKLNVLRSIRDKETGEVYTICRKCNIEI